MLNRWNFLKTGFYEGIIIDAESYELLSTIRPKEDFGIELAQHLHNVALHIHDGQLYLVCQAWNPGHYFVLQKV